MKNSSFTLPYALYICSTAWVIRHTMDHAVLLLVFTGEKKKPMDRWTWAVQPCAVQGQTACISNHNAVHLKLVQCYVSTNLNKKIKWGVSLVLWVSLALFSCWGRQGVSSLLISERVEILSKQILASLFSCCKWLFTCCQSLVTLECMSFTLLPPLPITLTYNRWLLNI